MKDAQLIEIKNRELAIANFKAAMVDLLLTGIDPVEFRRTFFYFAETLGVSPFTSPTPDPAKQTDEYLENRPLNSHDWQVGDVVYCYVNDFVKGEFAIKEILYNGLYRGMFSNSQAGDFACEYIANSYQFSKIV